MTLFREPIDISAGREAFRTAAVAPPKAALAELRQGADVLCTSAGELTAAPPVHLRGAPSPVLAPRLPAPLPVYAPPPEPPETDISDPYVGYSRRLTAAGGIAILYRDIATGRLQAAVRVFVWLVATILTGLVVLMLPVADDDPKLILFGMMALIYALILWVPSETQRRIEIRPDCMILDDEDVFWLDKMSLGWPLTVALDDGTRVLCGVYGTRFIEYLRVRKFDEEDWTPEVFEAHLDEAMQQLWGGP